MKPRILFISTPTSVGGGEVYLANLLPHLKDRYDCTVLGTRPIVRLLDGQVKTHRIVAFPKKLEKILKRHYRIKKVYYSIFFKQYLARNHYDLINFQEFDGAIVESVHHDNLILTEQTRLFISGHLRDWAKNWLNKMSRIICVSRQTMHDVTSLGVDESRCVVIHNAVDVDKFKPSKGGEYIDWVGRVEEEDKNPLLFVQIAEAAQAHNLKYKFRLIGGGRALGKMRDYAKEHEVRNIEFLGPRPASAMSEIYKDTKILCLTSRTEGIPYNVLEAMACGKPVIATNVGGVSEIIDSSAVGVLVDRPDEWKFLDAIKNLMEDMPEYRKMGQAARRRIQTEFSISRQVDETCRQFDKALGKNDV
jgi:glycosyltransferase involved in cell wall biosynthesis